MHFRRVPLACFAAALILFLSGCVTTAPSGSASNPTIPAATSNAQLRPGDSLTISLQGVPDPSINAVQIDDQGAITLPFIGAVTASGLNSGELAQRIRETYRERKIYNQVDVSVSVTERYVYVGGEVMRPGRIVWTPDLTVAKAIQAAGGFSLYARESRVSLVRDQQTYPVDVKLAQRNPSQDPRLVPGDSIQVPRSPF